MLSNLFSGVHVPKEGVSILQWCWGDFAKIGVPVMTLLRLRVQCPTYKMSSQQNNNNNNNNNLFPSVNSIMGFRTTTFVFFLQCMQCLFCTKGGHGLEHYVHPANR